MLKQPRLLWGHKLYIAALRLEDGKLLIVATQIRPDCAIADYAQRWGIEISQPQYPHKQQRPAAQVM
ncbi:MAG: hypothetical protein F6K28_44800 [Microcoleus sp. SIO2G3]|nr:hypothetical protein [Microcoleus sp. SIO2G3]